MNIYNNIKQDILAIICSLYPEFQQDFQRLTNNITAEPPKEYGHLDIATNVALIINKIVGKNPKEVAEEVALELQKKDNVELTEIAGPGFINIKLTNGSWHEVIEIILEQKERFGDNTMGANELINVEYLSANPTGPLHTGHARNAIYGDVIASLFKKCGYNVVKEFYINDAGGQIIQLVSSVYQRYLEAAGKEFTIGAGLYPGEYLIPIGTALFEKYKEDLIAKSESERFQIIRPFVIEKMLELIKEDSKLLGVYQDIFSSEYSLHQKHKTDEALKLLEEQDLIYTGILTPPKGKTPEDWEPREQLLLKTTLFGDDIDRPIKKSDGSWTYFGAEMGYVLDKLERGFKKMVLVLGADHGGYVKRTKALVSALSNKTASIEVKLYQLVKLVKGGEPLKMSKRAGTFITAKDMVDLIGKDILRFVMLSRSNEVAFDLDVDKVKEQSKDNPVFYVQYAHARCHSILRNARADLKEAYDAFIEKKDLHLELLNSEYELELIKLIASWPRVVEMSSFKSEVHRIVFYLQDVAAIFHGLWNRGKDDKEMRFIISNNTDITIARLALVQAVAHVIASAMEVLGVEPVYELT